MGNEGTNKTKVTGWVPYATINHRVIYSIRWALKLMAVREQATRHDYRILNLEFQLRRASWARSLRQDDIKSVYDIGVVCYQPLNDRVHESVLQTSTQGKKQSNQQTRKQFKKTKERTNKGTGVPWNKAKTKGHMAMIHRTCHWWIWFSYLCRVHFSINPVFRAFRVLFAPVKMKLLKLVLLA